MLGDRRSIAFTTATAAAKQRRHALTRRRETRAFLGNLPQGLSHLAIIHAALTLKEDGARG